MGLNVATFRLAYVQTCRDRHGVLRHYFRHAGVRARLPGLPGSTEFMAAYRDALDGRTAALAPKVGRVLPGSFNALAVTYYATAAFIGHAAATQRTYRNLVEALRAEHGDKPVAMLQAGNVRRMIDAKADRPAAANALLKMLRILMQLAVVEGVRKDDPTIGIRRVRSKSDGHATWSESDIAAFEARWPIGTRERLALALMLYTGQRGRSDVSRMGRQHLRDGLILVRQEKTGTELAIPVHPILRAVLDATLNGQMAFLTTGAGQPFTSPGFGNWFADAVRSAGLIGLAAHGLRKAAARRMAEAGCTAHQIAAITGHRSLREVERYTRAADQLTQARAAVAKMTRGVA